MSLSRRHALTLALAALASAGRADTDTSPLSGPIRIATEGAFPPYNALDAQGNLKGFEIDLARAICATEGLEFIWVVTDWADMIPGLMRSDFDVVMAGMGITPARAAQISFGREYFPGESHATGMFVGTHTFQSPYDGTIAVQAGTIHEDHLKAKGALILACDTAGAALAAVLDGRADTAFGSPDFLERKVWHTSRTLVLLGSEEIAAGGAAPAFRKGDDALRLRFDDALGRLTADGTLDHLRDTWFTPSRDI